MFDKGFEYDMILINPFLQWDGVVKLASECIECKMCHWVLSSFIASLLMN